MSVVASNPSPLAQLLMARLTPLNLERIRVVPADYFMTGFEDDFAITANLNLVEIALTTLAGGRLVACLYRDLTPITRGSNAAWGVTQNGEASFSNRVGLGLPENGPAAYPIAVTGGRIPQLNKLDVYQANSDRFGSMVERMRLTIINGIPTQGGVEIGGSEPTADLQF